jgi:hypothetical protein
MRYLIIILSMLLSSCSAQWHIRKAIKKDPSIVNIDTLRVIDTVTFITKEVQVDSVFRLTTDTVVIRKDNLTIKHYYTRDSVFIWGECASDTIYKVRELKIPYKQLVYKEKFIPNWVYFTLISGLIFLLVRKSLN